MFGGITIIMLLFMGISWYVGNKLKKKFEEYSHISSQGGLSGAEIAKKMLSDNGIYDVNITCVDGQLTDHYNPMDKTINLSRDVYNGRSVSSAAVAAHETGHAIQHAESYAFLQFRSAMVPLVNLSSKLMNIIFIASIFFSFILHSVSGSTVLWIIVLAQGTITLFSLIALPVEFDASNRALVWLESSGMTRGIGHDKAKDALNWAAMTYVVAALAAITSLLYYLFMLLGRRD